MDALQIAKDALLGVNTVWVLVAAFLVMFMQAGFAMVEAGMVRSKNTVNILMKNFIDYCLGSIAFFLIGYAFMFGDGNGFIGLSGFGMQGVEASTLNGEVTEGGIPIFAFLIFQTVFAATAATIVSGSVAERMKFPAYFIYSVVICAFVYPITGHWTWGGGWLSGLGFSDFAGSTVVHGVGGAMALAGAIVLGPRVGKYNKDGSANMIAGHSMPLAALGVFILWFGWFGFNPGSQVAAGGIENAGAIAMVAVNTNLAAAAGGFIAMLFTWILFKKPDLSMTMNGVLAGLVAITAPCAEVTAGASIAIGAVAGILIVLGVLILDKMKIDDPVGAISVHGINGIWGTLSIGLFSTGTGLFSGHGLKQLAIQALGTFSSTLFAFAVMFIVFYIIKVTVGLRVSRLEELRGLDIGEHGMEAYGDFQSFSTK